MLRPTVTLPLLAFLAAIVALGFVLGHGYTALGVAGFLFFLASIDAKPSWKRIWDPDPKDEGGILRFLSFKRVTGRPNDRGPFYTKRP